MSKSQTTIKGRIKTSPGEILKEEFLVPMGLSARAFAEHLGVPPNRITGIINGARKVTPETALMFEQVLGTSAQFWLNAQTAHDLSVARMDGVQEIEPLLPAE